ncbi:relaxase/mobilization nuclease domain-containing protein [Hyunsoonleella pacifica]|uniref:MobA/VirD2-like nuclease domain-containing protein n=1 Tax=Hyunsoonleella pacifica TaxID=1080224 RepID=A0A4Q9FKI2_9FLAO|nr:relaxase/mobilization nuclease domain-containing protein [Hyunsoonleella pacifica]TBN14415.1 hypothetical protein EYD46_12640 [Hyunsoonleella pacifica]GGD13542.1 hypothetical protein GCM10011368_14430 [Hyunsoonleella pacifica]
MIAKQIKGKDFYGVLAYNQKKVEQGEGHVIDSIITLDETVAMTKEFNLVRQLRPRLGKAVYHVSLNLRPEENLSDEEFNLLGLDYLVEMGFDDNQYIIYRHTDQEHQHIHIIANRVKFSGEVVSDSKDYERSEAVVRKLEKKYGLLELVNKKPKNKTNLTQKEIEKTIRTGKIPIKLLLQGKIENSLLHSNNLGQFVQALLAEGISPKFNVSKSTGRVSGVSFRHDDVIYKGSTLGRNFSWNNIIKRIDYEQSRDHSIILEANRAKFGAAGVAFESSKGPVRVNKETNSSSGRSRADFEKSKYYLGTTQKSTLTVSSEFNSEWTAFKLELNDLGIKKSKKKRKKKFLRH